MCLLDSCCMCLWLIIIMLIITSNQIRRASSNQMGYSQLLPESWSICTFLNILFVWGKNDDFPTQVYVVNTSLSNNPKFDSRENNFCRSLYKSIQVRGLFYPKWYSLSNIHWMIGINILKNVGSCSLRKDSHSRHLLFCS